MAGARILSLLPSTTEIACALGLRDALVGRSHECDFPADVSMLPVATRARLQDGTSRQIDDRVKDLVERGLSIYDVDSELLRRLAPTLVLTQSQCEVCAASLDDVERALADWTEPSTASTASTEPDPSTASTASTEPDPSTASTASTVPSRPHIVSLAPATLADVWGDIARVAEAAGVVEAGRRLSASLTDRVTAIGERTGALRAPNVACIEWLDPPMAAGNWVPELVRLAGGNPLFGRTGTHSPWLAWEELVAADPDVVVFMPCGFDLPRTRRELEEVQGSGGPDWISLRAVQQGRGYLVDGNAFFNRPGPRLVESLEILAELLHPQHFEFGHGGAGWQQLSAEALSGPRSTGSA